MSISATATVSHPSPFSNAYHKVSSWSSWAYKKVSTDIDGMRTICKAAMAAIDCANKVFSQLKLNSAPIGIIDAGLGVFKMPKIIQRWSHYKYKNVATTIKEIAGDLSTFLSGTKFLIAVIQIADLSKISALYGKIPLIGKFSGSIVTIPLDMIVSSISVYQKSKKLLNLRKWENLTIDQYKTSKKITANIDPARFEQVKAQKLDPSRIKKVKIANIVGVVFQVALIALFTILIASSLAATLGAAAPFIISLSVASPWILLGARSFAASTGLASYFLAPEKLHSKRSLGIA